MLKYLFVAQFEDNSLFIQNEDDVSMFDEKRSAYYDLLQAQKKVKKFWLTDKYDTYLVDLEDGHFEINGKEFICEGQGELPDEKPVS